MGYSSIVVAFVATPCPPPAANARGAVDSSGGLLETRRDPGAAFETTRATDR